VSNTIALRVAASGHFFSDALRFRCAREVGREGNRSPLASVSHSTLWSPGSLAACLAHPSATSFPGIHLCAGHLRISISTERLPLAQGCYRLPSLKGVGLARAKLIVRHPRDRGLCVGEDTDSAELAPLGRSAATAKARAMAAHSVSYAS